MARRNHVGTDVLHNVRASSVIFALILAGCASRPPLEPPTIKSVPPALIADSGASLYVIEARNDWLDDGPLPIQVAPNEDDDPAIGPKPSSKAQWLGEQSLMLVLRYALSQRGVSFIGHADFQPLSGWPIEVTLFNPDAEVRMERGKRVGFRVRLKASPASNAAYAAIQWEVEKLTDGPAGSEDAGRKGAYPRVTENISAGSCWLPWKATLMIHHPKEGDRVFVILLRLSSLREP